MVVKWSAQVAHVREVVGSIGAAFMLASCVTIKLSKIVFGVGEVFEMYSKNRSLGYFLYTVQIDKNGMQYADCSKKMRAF